MDPVIFSVELRELADRKLYPCSTKCSIVEFYLQKKWIVQKGEFYDLHEEEGELHSRKFVIPKKNLLLLWGNEFIPKHLDMLAGNEEIAFLGMNRHNEKLFHLSEDALYKVHYTRPTDSRLEAELVYYLCFHKGVLYELMQDPIQLYIDNILQFALLDQENHLAWLDHTTDEVIRHHIHDIVTCL